MSDRRDRRAKRTPRPRTSPRAESSGSATGAIRRPAASSRRTDRRRTPTPGRAARRGATAKRAPARGRHGTVHSLGEARAHRRLREGGVAGSGRRRGSRPDMRPRRRRTIRTTKPLATRFGAGRPRTRLLMTLGLLLAVFGLVLGRVGWMQGGGQAEALRSKGAQQWTRERTIVAERGAIFDREGDELALSVPAATVIANPKQIKDPNATAAILADYLRRDATWERKMAATFAAGHEDVGYLRIARQIEPRVAERIDDLDLRGITVEDEAKRVLPGGNTGLSVVGRTDVDGVGIAGLEEQYDTMLAGKDGQLTIEVAPGGRTIAGTEHMLAAPIAGRDLVTSLDRSVQFAVEQALVKRVNITGAVGGQAIVMLTNGEVVAMASATRNDAGISVVANGNWAAVGTYEPGSVGKVITVAGAIEDQAVTADRSFSVPWTYDCTKDPTNGILHDSHQHDEMPLTVNQILVESSNVGTIKVGKELGYERAHHYLTAFGLGSTTALDFPGESAGILKPWQQWEGTERCTILYGQGLASTPIQLAAAVNVIANDGVYASPQLVTHTVEPDGSLQPAPAGPTRRVISESTAEQMQLMMRDVVCLGTAQDARVAGLSVAGKTGTAYKAQADGTYFNADGITHDYYSSFVGFFPAEDPQVTILISIDEPKSGFNSGGQAAAPLFQELVPTIRHELGIIPPRGSVDCNGNGA